jgi:hypothetical protein
MAILDFLQSLSIESMFREFFLPFLLTFVIFWGILSALRIFNRKINLILAFGITIAAAYGGLFTWLNQFILVFSGYVGIAAFGVLLVLGIVVWAYRRGEDIVSPSSKPAKIREKIEKLYEKASDTNDNHKRRAYMEEAKKLEMEYEVARRRAAHHF